MPKYFLLAFLLLFAALLMSITVETGSLKGFMYGSEPNCQYDNWVSHLAERIVSPDYNVYAPWDRQTNGFGDFHIPNSAEIASWSTIIDEFLLQNWDNVDDLIGMSGFPYQLIQFNDTDTNRTYYMLREIPNTMFDDNGTPDPYDDELGAFAWGWGLYIYNPEGDGRTIITAPHPCDDFMTPALSTYALQTWNAEFMLVSGAGREVQWTNVGPYSNSKSLSDPTRTNNHPWYPAYTAFCNKIRNDTGKREFSAQIHSYDTNLHTGFSSVQISAGYNRTCPNLPIRDLSRFKNDLINTGNYLLLPENTIGSNANVYVNDYYTVQYDTHPFTFSDDDTTFTINNVMDLPAYSQNVQMNYTLNGWTDYDVFEPFFHAEMDELPNCYEQTDNNYKWFWSWNVTTQMWDMRHLFDHAIQYYSIWINNMTQVLTDALALDDGLQPEPPANLTVFNQSYDYITLRWDKADDYDFDTYEIQYADQPITGHDYNTFTRTNNSFLASPYCQEINVTGLNNSGQYYFRIRAKDKNGTFSTVSNEVTGYTIPVKITNYRAIGRDDFVILTWNVISQQNNQGFNIYRSVNGSQYQVVDSYNINAALAGGYTYYNWTDNNVMNDYAYTYKISCFNDSLIEFYHNVVTTGYPRDYFTLYISRSDQTMVDSLTFSANPNASSGNDSDYDVVKGTNPTASYVYGAFWEQYWGNNGTYLQQEILADFNPEQTVRTWSIRVKSDQLNTPLIFSVDDSYTRYTEKLYLRDNSTGAMTDLTLNEYTFMVSDTNYKSFTLYWGNLQPAISISNLPNRIYQGGSVQTFYWGANYGFLVDHYDVSIQTANDSIMVASSLPNSNTSYAFGFPSNHEMQQARLYVDAWATDGQRIRQISGFQFGIVPATTVNEIEPGLHMVANVWPNSSLTIPQVYGNDSPGWTMDTEGDWWQIDPFIWGLGYWVNKINPFQYSSTSPIQRDSTSFYLRPGWNIIPNPHICDYQVKDLRFRINAINYSFAELMDQQLVSRGVYIYRNGNYIQTDVIHPQESFLIKYYGSIEMPANIVFIPYNNGPSIQQLNPDWTLKLSASQAEGDTDELIIGANSRSTDEYDFLFDLPEPPDKPLTNLTNLYLAHSHADTLYLDFQLNAEFKSQMNDPEEEKIWNFKLKAGNTGPVIFTIDDSQFPDWYGAAISIGDMTYNIQHGNTFTYQPPSAGTHTGQIIIHNYFTGNDDATIPTLTSLKAYPNPFNPQVNLAFTLNKAGKVTVDIYNIKGQLVKSIHKGTLAKGSQRLTWDGRNDKGRTVGSGLYFARIQAADTKRTLKLMLLK